MQLHHVHQCQDCLHAALCKLKHRSLWATTGLLPQEAPLMPAENRKFCLSLPFYSTDASSCERLDQLSSPRVVIDAHAA